MAIKEVQPLFLSDVVLAIGTDEYQKHVDSVTFTPTTPGAVSWTGLGGNTHSRTPRSETWVCGLGYVQDWDTDGSLSELLHTSAGEQLPVVFTPQDGSEPWYSTIDLAAGPIGGTGQAFSAGTVSLACTRPERTAPPA
jgi:hypothetical protein